MATDFIIVSSITETRTESGDIYGIEFSFFFNFYVTIFSA